jgi:hypothetical protein
VGALRRCRRGLWIVRKELGYPAESTGSPRLLDLPLTLGVPTFELLASGGARGSASIGGGSTSGTTGFGGGAGTGGASGMVAGVGGSVAGGATLSTHWRHVTCLAALSHCARVPAGRTLRNRNKHRHASGPLPSSPRGRRYHNGRVGRPPHCRAHGRFVRWWVARFRWTKRLERCQRAPIRWLLWIRIRCSHRGTWMTLACSPSPSLSARTARRGTGSS